MDQQQSIIKTDQLTKHFKNVEAVTGLNLDIKKGEVYGLVGPDGAGKTTTLRMLSAIMDPTSGNATIVEFDLRQQPERIKEHIGYLAQQFALYGDLTVLENINFFADVYGVRGKARRQRTERLLEFARLTEFTGRQAGRLSGGMKKKLGLACALIHEPDVLHLDEPTTGVDPVSRREFWDILANLHVEGTTILVSTPYMDEAERCSRVGLMYGGRLIEQGTPNQLKQLIPGQLVEFRPESDQIRGVGLLRKADRLLVRQEGVLEVQTYGDLVRVFVDDLSQRQGQLVAALAAEQIRAENLRRAAPQMEEAFISLVSRMDRQDKEEEVDR
jgi:ABC-2 type transport system ATP-binding protein